MSYEKTHVTSDGARISGPAEVVDSVVAHEAADRVASLAWVATLRAQGIKAAHPDDGWVDRNANTIIFAYPEFDDGPLEGDRIALGGHGQHRVVMVTGVTARPLDRQPAYSFVEVEESDRG